MTKIAPWPNVTSALQDLKILRVIPTTSPLYKQIDRKNINSPSNQQLSIESPALLEYLLKLGLDASHNQNCLLRQAVKSQQVSTVELLLAQPKVDPNAAFTASIQTGKPTLVQLFLRDDRLKLEGSNYLEWALNEDHPEILALLLQSDRFNPTAYSSSVVMDAARYGYPQCLQLLLKNPRVQRTCSRNELVLAAGASNKPEIIKMALNLPEPANVSHRYEPTSHDNYLWRESVERGYTALVEILLADPRIDPTINNHQALITASFRGYPDMVRLLLKDKRVDPTAQDCRAMRVAIERGRNIIIQLFLVDGRVKPGLEWFKLAESCQNAELMRLLGI
jgi:hypothetical protein